MGKINLIILIHMENAIPPCVGDALLVDLKALKQINKRWIYYYCHLISDTLRTQKEGFVYMVNWLSGGVLTKGVYIVSWLKSPWVFGLTSKRPPSADCFSVTLFATNKSQPSCPHYWPLLTACMAFLSPRYVIGRGISILFESHIGLRFSQ